MADWPPMKSGKPQQEKEKMYLTLVDMFVDVVEPAIVQMVLQNRNWDLDAALEDIMILSSSTKPDRSRKSKSSSSLEAIQLSYPIDDFENSVTYGLQDENISSNISTLVKPQHKSGNSSSNLEKINPKKTKAQSSNSSQLNISHGAKKSSSSNQLPLLEQYNYVKSFPDSHSRAIMLIKYGVKLMIIVRGPPGSGKSYLAKKILSEAGIDPFVHRKHIFSSDDYFVQNNTYVFVADLLGEAHTWNQRNVRSSIREQVSPIIVDNTNTQAWEMRVYAEMAVSAGYDLEILEPNNWWANKDNELAKRNVHCVPKAKIRNMIERYEKNITPNVLLQQFDLRYSLSNAPPQAVRNSKWRDKFSSQKNNKPRKKKCDLFPQTVDQTMLNSMVQSLSSYSDPEFKHFPSNSVAGSFENVCNTNMNIPIAESSSNSVQIQTQIDNLPKKNGEHDYVQDLGYRYSKSRETVLESSINSPVKNTSYDGLDSMTVRGAHVAPNLNPEPGAESTLVLNQSSTKQTTSEVVAQDLIEFTELHSKNQDVLKPFDFMAESNKLLAALGKSTTPNKNVSSSVNQVPVGTDLPEKNVLDNIFVCKGGEIYLSNLDQLKYTSDLNPICCSIVEENETFHEKVIAETNILDSVIENVVNETEDLKPIKLWVDDKSTSMSIQESEFSRDYILVSGTSTFTYQRLDSKPLPLSPVLCQDSTVSVKNSELTNTSVSDNQFQYEDYKQISENLIQGCSVNFLLENDHFKELKSKNDLLPSHPLFKSDLKNEQAGSLKTDLKENVEIVTKNCVQNMTDEMHIIKNGETHNMSFDSTSRSCKEIKKTVGSSGDGMDSNVFGLMQTILDTMVPLCESSQTINSNINLLNSTTITSSGQETQEEKDIRIADKTFTTNCTGVWDEGDCWWNTDQQIKAETIVAKPKPIRNVIRPRITNYIGTLQQSTKQDTLNLGTWDTVKNPLDYWGVVENSVEFDVSREESPSLPQRPKINKKLLVDSSTNTNYLDFSLVHDENAIGVKILMSKGRNITIDIVCKVKADMVETLFLDKSTMTSENVDKGKNYDISQISSLFPNIPENYILDMVEKCQGNIDWAVDLLLDSKHIYPLHHSEENTTINDNGKIVEPVVIPTAAVRKSDLFMTALETPDKAYNNSKPSPKRECKSINLQEQAELKKLIESSVIFDKSHYSDKVLKVIKKKHPEYLDLIEHNQPRLEKSVETLQQENICKDQGDDIVIEDDEEEESNSASDVEDEDDTLEFILNNDLIIQLQQKFGNSDLPRLTNLSPVVKLPVSLARQMYGYVMDSLQSEMDEHQNAIERTIAQDEEVAKLVQFQDQSFNPQLQEIMDMEVALAVYRADQEEWKKKCNETLAAKLSKNILFEKFPNVDPKMLMEVLHAHNYSLHDTVASLTLALEEEQALNTGQLSTVRQDLAKEARASSVPDAEASPVPDPLSTAQSHREQAASYYSLRMECLNKAQEAFRAGNKPVATYYSQLAALHKEKMEQCNSRAAAWLLSTHKCGTNTLDLHFLHVTEAEVVLDMFLDEVITQLTDSGRRHQRVFLITGRGRRSVGGISRIKPMVQKKLHNRQIIFDKVNPGMLSALVRVTTSLSHT